MQEQTIIKIENLKKQYRLGSIGGGTLSGDLKSWWARKRGKEDPNSIIGTQNGEIGQRFWALNGINLEVKKGEAVGIIGMNGAGKSTLLKILSRVTAPTEGDIWINGKVASMLEVGTGFHAELTGRENIYLNGAILGMTRKEVDEKIEDIIEFSECRQFIDTPVKRYSSGMYVKLAFAVAAHLDADILIMDEVLAVGDMKFQKKCLGKMGEAAEQQGKTVLYVSHNMNTIRQLCSRCLVMQKGQIVFDGQVENAIKLYMSETTGEFLHEYDFTNAKRANIDWGRKAIINRLIFTGKEKAVYETDEKIKFFIDITTYEKVQDLTIQISMAYADSTIVGMTRSKPAGELQEGKQYRLYFEYDASNLVSGTYYFTPVISVVNEFGTREVYDAPNQKVFVAIGLPQEESQWLRKYWGSVRLNPIIEVEREVIDEKDIALL